MSEDLRSNIHRIHLDYLCIGGTKDPGKKSIGDKLSAKIRGRFSLRNYLNYKTFELQLKLFDVQHLGQQYFKSMRSIPYETIS